MANPEHTATFSSKKFSEDLSKMRARREKVHDKGEEVYRRTGKMDPLVSVQGCKVRKSQFAFTRNPDGTFTLVNGYKRPYMNSTDGTGSFAEYIARAFEASPKIYGMLEANANGNHQMDFSFSVFQDRDDRHDVIQVPEFESDNRFAEHMKLLVPDRAGGDTPEDYDVGIWYAANMVEADIFRYGGKGYFTLLLDAPGRGVVEKRLIKRTIGCELQSDVSTRDVWNQLQEKFHSFVVVFGSSSTASWWRSHIGHSSVIEAPHADLFAEVQAGLVYVTDNQNPTENGLYDFLRKGQGSTVTKRDALQIFEAYKRANVEFGANAKLKLDLPKPGSVFQHMTDLWPIGHPRASENPAPGLPSGLPDKSSDDTSDSDTIDWSRF